MALKELIGKLRGQMTQEELDKHAPTLAEMDRETTLVLSSLKTANGSDAEARIELRKKDEEIASLQGQIAGFATLKTENERLTKVETEFNSYKEKQNQALIEKWKEKEKQFEVVETDPLFAQIEKIKHRFKFENVTASDAQANLNLFEIYQETGVFESKKSDRNDAKPAGGAQRTNPFDPKTRNIAEQIRLKKENPALYEELKNKARS